MTEENKGKPLEKDELLDLSFVPQWARSEKGDVSVVKNDSRVRGRPNGDRRGDRRGTRSRGDTRGADRRGMSMPRRGGERRDMHQGGATRESHTGRGGHRERRSPASQGVSLPLKMSFLPERRGLGVIVRRIRKSGKAFSLPAIADLFLGKPEYYLLKVEVTDSDTKLFQCNHCKGVFQTRPEAVEHLLKRHIDNYFEMEVKEGAVPAGNFQYIAKCGLSGQLIGPPNHHTYREKIRQIHSQKYPDMPIAQYEQRIVTIEDEETLEQWKKEVALTTEYRLKSDETAEPVDEKAARAYVLEHCAKEIKENNRFVIPAQAAWATDDPVLLRSFKNAWIHEKRFPLTLIHALRPALRHMKLKIFKVGPKETFVSAIQPSPIDPEYSVSPINEALEYIKTHTGCKRDELMEFLLIEDPEHREKIDKVLTSLHWLIDCGHVVEFADGSLAIPSGKNRL